MDPEIARNPNYDDHYADDSKDVHSAALTFNNDRALRIPIPTKAATCSNLIAATLVSSRGPVLVMSWRRSPGQVAAHGLGHIRSRFLADKADGHSSFHWRC